MTKKKHGSGHGKEPKSGAAEVKPLKIAVIGQAAFGAETYKRLRADGGS